MNSFNHYAYGAIGDWMYRVSAGIETMGPGYRHIIIQPHTTDKMTYSKASLESPYGTIASGWERKDGKVTVKVIIPANTMATIILPVINANKVTESGMPLSQNIYLKDIKTSDNKIVLEAGSGEYSFEIAE
jgi:alpha-L-rhamnosidase